MLQNPSKYHGNPLSHFLALHNTQVAHNSPHTNSLPAPVVILGQSQYHHHQQQQQIHSNHYQLRQTATAMSSHGIHHIQQQQLQEHQPHQLSPNLSTQADIMDDANTSLDVGKSFTIAAILGLQKSSIEENRREYNNVINLSMNSGCTNYLHETNNNHNNNNNNNKTCIKNNNNSINSKISISEKTNDSSNLYPNFVNSFNNEKSTAIVNRYVTTSIGATSSVVSAPSSTFGTTITAHQQPLTTNHLRANSFAAAVAVAAAANVSNSVVGGPSALQSLQQLHQHHAQQANLNYQREKLKSESKKTSLKNKRVRTIFTPEQLERLEAEFERQQYMVGPERLYLAHTLQLTEAQVKVWFQNRRIKWRKHHLELTQQRLALLRQGQLPGPTIPEDSALPNTRASSVSCDDVEDIKHENRHIHESQEESESELSICNDSIDGDSAIEGGEDT